MSYSETTCRGCGKPIRFAAKLGDESTRIPLDVRAAVYRIVGEQPDGTPIAQMVERGEVYVTHFATCPEARQFSGGKKARKTETPGG